MNALTCLLLACAPAGPLQDAAAEDAMSAQRAAFEATMKNAVLTGRFTVDGAADKMPEERYEIGQVSYVKEDLWTIAARIQYGKNDVTVPVPVKVFWAGDTPVITLEETTLPGMGTFSARVLVHKTGSGQTRYAGTWQHDDKGGCMFGIVTPRGEKE
ncbi:hypothetical protein [Alienimonas chondri]|uniref:Uncharacterized protein n=1 Tax=Alienimonas chondri TaxID=2681879 RepID=A0ABX1VH65_9PLAN|nr:hypothetical protein [Alienimonas chondri]NNJ27183.1 hypothetical protein [Alienimonas chondri]